MTVGWGGRSDSGRLGDVCELKYGKSFAAGQEVGQRLS